MATWPWLLGIALIVILVVVLRNRAEEPQTRHAAPGQGRPPEVKEREQTRQNQNSRSDEERGNLSEPTPD